MSEQQLNIERFRILVIGNANAGKTTILEKVCHARGRQPVCLDVNGNKINLALQPSSSRGEHNIEHQFQYPTAHGFIFHDSRGFEAGGADELKKVKEFVQSRAEKKELKDQLHAIWYCLTTSNDRAMTEAEMSLFKSGTGNVPVIAIFTKMDALDGEARSQLVWEKVPFRDINKQVPIRAEAIFEKKYLQRFQEPEVKHKPRYIVQLRDMNKEGTDCDDLITRTSQALNGATLKLFCLSILLNDVESRIKDAITNIIIPRAQAALESPTFSEEQAKSLFCEVMCCFPHMLVRICS
ncbi:hypothetical protein M378DRAFT_11140 [Amanita muscaria Koide BX008]|uniref:G domain-containing protein n=1 Tax=Amanita muscaria (strain Koide BX008) TaxID=946122 RepID=A0A0C2X6Z1_AMAMK|nr:hypothetical protein M378DRAFT_11140 [Amanita muscaria Koide BX008]